MMPIALCFICVFNASKKRIPDADQRPSYTDCDRCRQPTCRGHGKAATSERFLCIRCIGAGA
jgi:hypothetical protein